MAPHNAFASLLPLPSSPAAKMPSPIFAKSVFTPRSSRVPVPSFPRRAMPTPIAAYRVTLPVMAVPAVIRAHSASQGLRLPRRSWLPRPAQRAAPPAAAGNAPRAPLKSILKKSTASKVAVVEQPETANLTPLEEASENCRRYKSAQMAVRRHGPAASWTLLPIDADLAKPGSASHNRSVAFKGRLEINHNPRWLIPGSHVWRDPSDPRSRRERSSRC